MSADPGLLDRAAMLLSLRRHDEAKQYLARHLAHAPEDYDALHLLGQAHLATDEPQLALQAVRRLAAINPDDPRGHLLASATLSALTNHGAALQAAERTVQLAPNWWLAHARLAETLLEMPRRKKEALASAWEAVRLAPLEPDAHYTVGFVAQELGRRVEAREAIEHTLSLDPQHALAQSELARLQMSGRFPSPRGLADATAGFANAVRTDPRDAMLRGNLDLAVRHFMAHVAYFVLLNIFLGRFLLASMGVGRAHVLLAFSFAVPAYIAVRYVHSLTPQLRAYVWQVLRTPGVVPVAVLEMVAIASTFAAYIAPTAGTEQSLAPAFGAAVAARVFLALEVRRTAERAKIRINPMLSDGVVVVVILLMVGMASFFVWLGRSTGKIALSVALAVGCTAIAVMLVHMLWRRRQGKPMRTGIASGIALVVAAVLAYQGLVSPIAAAVRNEPEMMDQADTEAWLERELTARRGTPVQVACPADQPLQPGHSFICTVAGWQGGSVVDVLVERTDWVTWRVR